MVFKKYFIYLFIFRKRGREGEREGEKHQGMVATHVPPPPLGVLACNPGMCSDWELNQWPFGSQAGTHPVSHTSQARFLHSWGQGPCPIFICENINSQWTRGHLLLLFVLTPHLVPFHTGGSFGPMSEPSWDFPFPSWELLLSSELDPLLSGIKFPVSWFTPLFWWRYFFNEKGLWDENFWDRYGWRFSQYNFGSYRTNGWIITY